VLEPLDRAPQVIRRSPDHARGMYRPSPQVQCTSPGQLKFMLALHFGRNAGIVITVLENDD
jgi:hypothetical protein